jgi:hypothetical protein
MLKLFVFVPDQQEIIEKIMSAATSAGAGIIGNYSGCGFITKGTGNWKSEEGSNPTIGKVGFYSHEPEARIEMICPETVASNVKKAILEIHPYEEPEIDFVKLVDVE